MKKILKVQDWDGTVITGEPPGIVELKDIESGGIWSRTGSTEFISKKIDFVESVISEDLELYRQPYLPAIEHTGKISHRRQILVELLHHGPTIGFFCFDDKVSKFTLTIEISEEEERFRVYALKKTISAFGHEVTRSDASIDFELYCEVEKFNRFWDSWKTTDNLNLVLPCFFYCCNQFKGGLHDDEFKLLTEEELALVEKPNHWPGAFSLTKLLTEGSANFSITLSFENKLEKNLSSEEHRR
jgi:hypothetical protein